MVEMIDGFWMLVLIVCVSTGAGRKGLSFGHSNTRAGSGSILCQNLRQVAFLLSSGVLEWKLETEDRHPTQNSTTHLSYFLEMTASPGSFTIVVVL